MANIEAMRELMRCTSLVVFISMPMSVRHKNQKEQKTTCSVHSNDGTDKTDQTDFKIQIRPSAYSTWNSCSAEVFHMKI